MNYRMMALLLVSLFSGSASAVDGPAQKLLEQQAETEYCESKVAGRRNRDDPDWGHMHHYCYALGFQSRALKSMARPTEFRSNIEQALDNFNYVLSHVSPGFYMLPEVMIEKGRTLQLAKRTTEATALFTEALILNPNLTAGYVALADQLSDTGNKSGALLVVKNGLQHVPDSRALQRRYLTLGGKEPFPGATPTKQGGEPQPAKQ